MTDFRSFVVLRIEDLVHEKGKQDVRVIASCSSPVVAYMTSCPTLLMSRSYLPAPCCRRAANAFAADAKQAAPIDDPSSAGRMITLLAMCLPSICARPTITAALHARSRPHEQCHMTHNTSTPQATGRGASYSSVCGGEPILPPISRTHDRIHHGRRERRESKQPAHLNLSYLRNMLPSTATVVCGTSPSSALSSSPLLPSVAGTWRPM